TYPLLLFGARASLDHLINQLKKFYKRKIKKEKKMEDVPPTPVSEVYKELPTSESELQLSQITPQPIKHEESMQDLQGASNITTSESQLELTANMVVPVVANDVELSDLPTSPSQIDIGKKIEAN